MSTTFTRASLLAASALIVLSAAGQAGAAHPRAMTSPQAKAPHGLSQAAKANPMSLLYTQMNNDSGIGTVSQNFGDEFDSAAADDFEVSDNAIWTVKFVDVVGAYFNGSGPVDSVNVIFYKAKHGKPAKIKAEIDNLVPVSDDAGSWTLKLPGTGLKLKAGHYYVSVVANMDFATGGEWAWENQALGTTEGDPAMWRNPGDGFGSGCTKWTVEAECDPTPLGDHMFALRGTVKIGLK